MPSRVVAFTGMPGSGKTQAVEVAAERGLPVVRMGDLVREETEDRGLELTDAEVGRVAVELREQEGDDVWAVRTLERLKALDADADADLAVVDGVRGLAEVERFRDALGAGFVLVAVHASPQTRYARIRDRGRADDAADREAFKARDERELGFGIGTAIALADVLLANEGTPDALRGKVERLLDELEP